MKFPKLGIIGAGKLAVTLAPLATRAGYSVAIAGSDDPEKIALTVKTLTPGAQAATTNEVIARSDVILLALPLSQIPTLAQYRFDDKLVIDATNHWYEVDGPRQSLLPNSLSSSEWVAQTLSASQTVKALSHMGYHDIFDEAAPQGTPNRKAIALAGDNSPDVDVVMQIIDNLGFDPLSIGKLSQGELLEPGKPAFGADLPLSQLDRLIKSSS